MQDRVPFLKYRPDPSAVACHPASQVSAHASKQPRMSPELCGHAPVLRRVAPVDPRVVAAGEHGRKLAPGLDSDQRIVAFRILA